MSKAMTMPEFLELYDHIMQHHTMKAEGTGVAVKYVHPYIDTRTGEVYAISLRPWYSADLVCFHTVNESRDIPDSLFDRTMRFLDGEEAVV